MPHWVIYYTKGTLDSFQEKQKLSENITAYYTRIGLPAFYVVINYVEQDPTHFWVGGKARTDRPCVRIQVSHIAKHVPSTDEGYGRITMSIDKALAPTFEGKGWDWEYHVAEDERRLWKVNGLIPPPLGSEEEKVWIKEDRAMEYPGAWAPGR